MPAQRLTATPECHDDAHATAVRSSTLEMLDDAEKALEPAGRFAQLREFFSWSGSREAGALSAAHEAERLIVAWLLPDISVHGRLQRARCELQSLPDGQRQLWSDTLDKAELGHPDVVRATIGEMLADVYSRRDTAYSELWSLKNKIAWFEWAGLLAAVLIVCRGRGMLLFAGAVGGLLSRMQRALKRRPIRTDYGGRRESAARVRDLATIRSTPRRSGAGRSCSPRRRCRRAACSRARTPIRTCA
jgi:hypothetical protein